MVPYGSYTRSYRYRYDVRTGTCVCMSHVLLLSCFASELIGNATVTRKSFRSKLENGAVTSSFCLGLLLLLGHLARRRVIWLRALHLPSSLLGGIIGWLVFFCIDFMGEDASALSDDWFSVGWNGLEALICSGMQCCMADDYPLRSASWFLHRHRLLLPLFGHASSCGTRSP